MRTKENSHAWTDARTDLLTVLHKQGLSASKIAAAINAAHPGAGLTRNAVVGRAHRIGLGSVGGGRASAPGRVPEPTRKPPQREVGPSLDHPWRPGSAGKTKLHPAGNRVYVVSEDRPLPERCEPAGTCTLLTLGAHMCKWPIGDPKAEDFTFCGRRSEESSPYCFEHHAVAYQPPREPSGPRTEAQRLGDLKRRATWLRRAAEQAVA